MPGLNCFFRSFHSLMIMRQTNSILFQAFINIQRSTGATNQKNSRQNDNITSSKMLIGN